MALIGLSDDKVEEIISAQSDKQVWPANYNCDGQLVVAGNKDDLASKECYRSIRRVFDKVSKR